MNIITFNNVHFSYPPVEGDVDENGNQIQSPVVFDHFSAELPSGFVQDDLDLMNEVVSELCNITLIQKKSLSSRLG